MVLDKLGDSLKGTLQKIAKSMFVDEKLLNEVLKDIQRALLQADVNVKLVFNLTNNIKQKALEHKADTLTRKEKLIQLVYDELVSFLGGEGHKLDLTKKPLVIMLVGLFGSGKTTTSGKLAHFFTKRGFTVGLVGLDIHRPAAMDQLEQIAKTAKVPSFTKKGEKDPVKVWNEFKDEALKNDVVIVDTAGRDALSKDLIEEIETLSKLIKADENFLVISADIGQAAQSQAEEFHRSCGITGVIATKMDGTAKAGGALSACSVTDAPIKFIGVGEKTEDLEEFKPENFVSRLLGMGDLETLLEKAQEVMTEDSAKDMEQKFMSGKFSLLDLYEQMSAMRKMGPLNKIMDMIPGMGQMNLPKEALQVQEGKLDKWKYLLDSMTQEELENPDVLERERIDRISKGSGSNPSEIRELLKQYKQSKKVMKMFKGGKQKNMQNMMKKMGNMKGKPGLKF